MPQTGFGDKAITPVALILGAISDERCYPWLILVPRVAGARDMIDLSESDQMRLTREIAQASSVLRQETHCDKLNVAALGNVVPQLHVHVIARFKADAAWPKPIWGVVPPAAFPAAEVKVEVSRWQKLLLAGQ